MKKFITIFAILLLLIASCGKKESAGNKESKKDNPIDIRKEKFNIITSDNKKISAVYFYQNNEVKQPLIILIHQFNSNKEQWNQLLIDTLVNNGYKVLIFDLRSHGESDKANVPLENLLTDKEQTPKDVEAVFKWANEQKGIDNNRIGVVGTSIGGSLSLLSMYNFNAKTAIGISVGNLTFSNLTGNDMRLGRVMKRIPNVLLICGTKDGDYAKESQEIFDNFLSDPKEYKQFESEYHGKDLIKTFPGINDLIINWFLKNL